MRDLGQINGADEVREIGRGWIVWCISANTHARCFREEDSLDGHAQEVAFELALQSIARPRTQLTFDLYAIRLAELAAQARRNEIERRFMHGRALQGIHSPFVSVAVFLETAFQQDGHGGLATRRRA